MNHPPEISEASYHGAEAALEQVIARASTAGILVIGDVMLDEFVFGAVQRISPEAPVPIVEITGRRFAAGGAANVAANEPEFQSARPEVTLPVFPGGTEFDFVIRPLGFANLIPGDPWRCPSVTCPCAAGHSRQRGVGGRMEVHSDVPYANPSDRSACACRVLRSRCSLGHRNACRDPEENLARSHAESGGAGLSKKTRRLRT